MVFLCECHVDDGGFLGFAVTGFADGNGEQGFIYDALDEVLGDVAFVDVSLDVTHAAADVHANCVWDDRVFCGENSANRHACAEMGVRHEGQPFVDEWEVRDLFCLLEAPVFNC